ncbi:hypothetical protein Nepgr_027572 [Nepenthes gracilis]|uniref:Uncharacterized protein n=1 Tax=Nepenthes gracilis TaxID=150966 RepID=A0AAD3TB17_NEPGR|nr:hypothetical protein Nepgr_027572 [Nepenthes gracilis]
MFRLLDILSKVSSNFQFRRPASPPVPLYWVRLGSPSYSSSTVLDFLPLLLSLADRPSSFQFWEYGPSSESLNTANLLAEQSFANLNPASRVSYSATLLVVRKPSLREYFTSNPSGVVRTTPAPLSVSFFEDRGCGFNNEVGQSLSLYGWLGLELNVKLTQLDSPFHQPSRNIGFLEYAFQRLVSENHDAMRLKVGP